MRASFFHSWEILKTFSSTLGDDDDGEKRWWFISSLIGQHFDQHEKNKFHAASSFWLHANLKNTSTRLGLLVLCADVSWRCFGAKNNSLIDDSVNSHRIEINRNHLELETVLCAAIIDVFCVHLVVWSARVFYAFSCSLLFEGRENVLTFCDHAAGSVNQTDWMSSIRLKTSFEVHNDESTRLDSVIMQHWLCVSSQVC